MNEESKQIKKLLETPFWLDGVDTKNVYQVKDDDAQGCLTVCFGEDGDAHIQTLMEPSYVSLRARTYAGGGRNLRTRMAIMFLALAIKLDNEEHAKAACGICDNPKCTDVSCPHFEHGQNNG